MAELSRLCAELGLDRTAAEQTLTASGMPGRHGVPAYVLALLGAGAWITAVLMVAFVLLFLDVVIGVNLEEQTPITAAVGAASFAIAVAWRRRATVGAFRSQLASALSIAGVALAVAAVLVSTESFWAACAVAALGAAAAIAEGRDRPTQFVAGAAALALAFMALETDNSPFLTEIAALCGAAGVLLGIYPPRLELAPLRTVLLLAMPLLMVVADGGVIATGDAAGLAARAVNAGVTIWLLLLHRRFGKAPLVAATTIVLSAGIVGVCALLPPGGSAALILMMLAFVLGLRGLAAIGVLFQIYFVWRFYYDLQISLLDKSLVLAGVGLMLLGAYALVVRQQAGAR